LCVRVVKISAEEEKKKSKCVPLFVSVPNLEEKIKIRNTKEVRAQTQGDGGALKEIHPPTNSKPAFLLERTQFE